MKKNTLIKLLFYVAAAYDGILGLIFLSASPWIFGLFSVIPPNHLGYVHFPAALLLVFNLMFLAVAVNPVKNRNLIPYGILLKVSYCGVTLWHWVATDIPVMWKPFVFLDLIFGILFFCAWQRLGRSPDA